MTPPTEPEVIALLRGVITNPDEPFHAQFTPLLYYIDAIRAERDAAVRERDEYRKEWDRAMGYWNRCAERVGALMAERDAAVRERDEAIRIAKTVTKGTDALRARLAACERVVEAAQRYYDATVRDEEWGYDVDRAYDTLMDTVGLYRAAVATAQGDS